MRVPSHLIRNPAIMWIPGTAIFAGRIAAVGRLTALWIARLTRPRLLSALALLTLLTLLTRLLSRLLARLLALLTLLSGLLTCLLSRLITALKLPALPVSTWLPPLLIPTLPRIRHFLHALPRAL